MNDPGKLCEVFVNEWPFPVICGCVNDHCCYNQCINECEYVYLNAKIQFEMCKLF